MEQQKPTHHSIPHSPEHSTQLLKKCSSGEPFCSQPYMNEGATLAMPRKGTTHVLPGTQAFILIVYLWFGQSFTCVGNKRVTCQNSVLLNYWKLLTTSQHWNNVIVTFNIKKTILQMDSSLQSRAPDCLQLPLKTLSRKSQLKMAPVSKLLHHKDNLKNTMLAYFSQSAPSLITHVQCIFFKWK